MIVGSSCKRLCPLSAPLRQSQAFRQSRYPTVRTMSSATKDKIAKVREILGSGRYSACDVSDALLKLKVPQAGFLPDIAPIPFPRAPSSKPLIAAISTVLFTSKSHPPPTTHPESNIPQGTHFTDHPAPDTIAILQQPANSVCACLGDIMASRLQIRGLRGVIADGRVRDLWPIGQICDKPGVDEGSQFSVWSRGASTVGTGLENQAWCVDVPLQIGGVQVRPGDVAFVDERERGVVVIPQEKIDAVVEMMPGLKDVDDRCVADVLAGVDVTEVFRRHR